MKLTLEQLKAEVATAEANLQVAKSNLAKFEQSPENHVYDSLEDAEYELTDILRERAGEDCEGSYNCGDDWYEKEFIVDGFHYVARLDCEHDRHDKTYYYLYSSKFKITKKD